MISRDDIVSPADSADVWGTYNKDTQNGAKPTSTRVQYARNHQREDLFKAGAEKSLTKIPLDQSPAASPMEAEGLLREVLIGRVNEPQQQFSLEPAIRLISLNGIAISLPSTDFATTQSSGLELSSSQAKQQPSGALYVNWRWCDDYVGESTWTQLLSVHDAISFRITQLQNIGQGAKFPKPSGTFSETLLALVNDLVRARELLGKQAREVYNQVWKVTDELALRKKWIAELVCLATSRAKDLEGIQRHHEAVVADLHEQHNTLLSQFQQRHTAIVKNAIQQVQQQHNYQMANLQRQHTDEVASLNDRIEELAEDYAEADDECTELMQRRSELENEVRTSKASEKACQQQLQGVQAKNHRLQEKECQSWSKINVLENQLHEMTERSSQVERELRTNDAQLRSATLHLETETERVGSLEQEVHDLQEKLRESEETAHYYRQNCDRAKEREVAGQVSEASRISKDEIDNTVEDSLGPGTSVGTQSITKGNRSTRHVGKRFCKKGRRVSAKFKRDSTVQNAAPEARSLAQKTLPTVEDSSLKSAFTDKKWDKALDEALDAMLERNKRLLEKSSECCQKHETAKEDAQSSQNSPRDIQAESIKATNGRSGDDVSKHTGDHPLKQASSAPIAAIAMPSHRPTVAVTQPRNGVSSATATDDGKPRLSSQAEGGSTPGRQPTRSNSTDNIESSSMPNPNRQNTSSNLSPSVKSSNALGLQLPREQRNAPIIVATPILALTRPMESPTPVSRFLSSSDNPSPPGSPPPPYSANTRRTSPPPYVLAVGTIRRPLLQQPVRSTIAREEDTQEIPRRPGPSQDRAVVTRSSEATNSSSPSPASRRTTVDVSYDTRTYARATSGIASASHINHDGPNGRAGYKINWKASVMLVLTPLLWGVFWFIVLLAFLIICCLLFA